MEMKFDSIEFIFTIMGLAFIFTRVPQIMKLIKRKSSDDISLAYWYLVSILTLPWIWYAVYIAKSISMLFTYISTTILNFIIIYLIHKYKK